MKFSVGSVSDCDLFLFVSWRRARVSLPIGLCVAVCSSIYRVRRTVKKVQSPKVVLGRPHKPCHKLSLFPHFVRAQQGRPTQNIHGIYDRPGPWGVDSIEPKFKEGEEALKTDLAHCH